MLRKSAFGCILVLLFFTGKIISTGFPNNILATVYSSPDSSGSSCPSQDTINEEHKRIRESILEFYNRTAPSSCGGSGWTRVAYLNMSDTNQQCPSNWTLTPSPVRGCGRSSNERDTCDPVIYPVIGRTYSSVCGRIQAYQRGLSYGLYNSLYNGYTLDGSYISGVSVTHGPVGNRTHVWSFVGAASKSSSVDALYNCPCTSTGATWPYQVPPFINNDYFCDTGNSGSFDYTFPYYTEDPLWDGEGCGSTTTCCSFNSPPWFYKSFPQPTSDDLEIRLCYLDRGPEFEDKFISELSIYVK